MSMVQKMNQHALAEMEVVAALDTLTLTASSMTTSQVYARLVLVAPQVLIKVIFQKSQ